MKLKAGLIAVSLALAVPLIAGVYRGWSRASNSWQPAHATGLDGLIQQVSEEQINPDFDVQTGNMRVLEISLPRQRESLYLIDSQQTTDAAEREPLCGALGCAFFGYVTSESGYQNVLSLYLDPHLPPDIPLIEVGEVLQADMPELIVNQLEGTRILQMRMTLNDERYEVIEVKYLAQAYE